jgi:queuosine precursor transporter
MTSHFVLTLTVITVIALLVPMANYLVDRWIQGRYRGWMYGLIYVVAVLLANYTATPEWFLKFPIFGQVATGTLIFGITFTQRDRLHQFGRQSAYGAIAVAAFANVLMSAVLGVPGRIIFASFVAIILAETTDTEIYQKLLEKSWYTRVASSNAVSIPLDTLLFNLIAFLGVLSPLEMVSLTFGDIVVKYAIGLLTAAYRGKQIEQLQS